MLRNARPLRMLHQLRFSTIAYIVFDITQQSNDESNRTDRDYLISNRYKHTRGSPDELELSWPTACYDMVAIGELHKWSKRTQMTNWLPHHCQTPNSTAWIFLVQKLRECVCGDKNYFWRYNTVIKIAGFFWCCTVRGRCVYKKCNTKYVVPLQQCCSVLIFRTSVVRSESRTLPLSATSTPRHSTYQTDMKSNRWQEKVDFSVS